MGRRSSTALLLIAVSCIGAACRDVPLIPHWYADWNVPLPSQDIALLGPFPFTVMPGISASIGFPPQRQPLTGTAGDLLGQELSNAALVLSIRKTVPVSGTDTVFVAADSAGLRDSTATRIIVPVSVAATDQAITDTVPIQPAGLAMLQQLALAHGSAWVQLRGRVAFNGPGTLTVTAADSVHVRLSLLATIAVSH